ncbi:hypothetical protein DV735_g3470, partial [Chaetothyriales sp. CBS 134920]
MERLQRSKAGEGHNSSNPPLSNGALRVNNQALQPSNGAPQVNNRSLQPSNGLLQLSNGPPQVNNRSLQPSNGLLQLSNGALRLISQVHPTPPSPGYDPRAVAQGDASRDAKALRAAMKGFGTDERALIAILAKPDPLQMGLLRNTYNSILRRDLLSDIESETSGYFRDGLMSLVRGPLAQDVYNVNKAVSGMGTKESLLNDVLIGRTNADIRAIKQTYYNQYHRTMESDIRGDLSMKTEKLFDMILAATRAEEATPIIPQEIERHVGDLYAATIGRSQGADQITVCGILTSRSTGQIRAIAQQFEARYHTTLIKALERRFDGHMEDALVLLIKRASDPAMTDAEQLESAMSGIGTQDFILVQRIVRIHWNRQHLDQVKRAYQHRYKKDLIGRVKGEISNKHYEALMVACLS